MTHSTLNILVTRPAPSAASLCAAIEAKGNTAYSFPTIAITPIETQQTEEEISVLDQFDWLIFISPQSVLTSEAIIKKYWQKLPEQVRIAAVGVGTANTLKKAKLHVDVFPQENWNSEGLLALPEFQDLTNKKIAVFKGEGGRDYLALTLKERGADVVSIITYRRDLASQQPAPVNQLIQNNQINLIVTTSVDGLKNLKILFQDVWGQLKNIPLIVISKRMQDAANELGFQNILLAQNASDNAILSTIKQYQQGTTMADEQPIVNETQPSPRSVLAVLAILLALIALASIGIVSYMGVKQLKLLEGQLTSFRTHNSDKNALSDLQKSLTDTQQTVQALNEAVKTQQQSLTDLRTVQQTNRDVWTVAEAHYLAKLANDYLQIGNNIPVVIKLLQTSDQDLSPLTDPNVAPIRKALAADITALQAVPLVDIQGIYMRLTALDDEVDKLPLLNNRPQATPVTPNNSTGQLSWWKRGWHESMQTLKQLVVIRYNKNNERPFVTPEQQMFLSQNIHAMIEQALTALVHQQPDIFRASLTKAQSWISQYFIADSQVTQSVLNNLKELQAINIKPELPNITVTLQTFNDYTTASQPANQ